MKQLIDPFSVFAFLIYEFYQKYLKPNFKKFVDHAKTPKQKETKKKMKMSKPELQKKLEPLSVRESINMLETLSELEKHFDLTSEQIEINDLHSVLVAKIYGKQMELFT